ncbi:MAG: AsmA-like C-terminal region-containing protein, partial [Elusimicrobiota bacterium]|nr:AsmA-like C-terminal region-containing protein [Elusimicrobiota bacterium]
MKKILKILSYSAIFILFSGLLGFFALKHYFTPERIKELIIDFAQKNISREVSLDSASLKLNGFALKNLKVSEYPNFKKGEFLTAKEFILTPSLRDLLKKKIKINSISINGLKLRVVEVKKNVYNFADLIEEEQKKETKKSKPAPKLQSKPMNLMISDLTITDSRILFKNSVGFFIFKNIKLEAGNISPKAAFPYKTHFIMDAKTPSFKGELPASLSGNLKLPGFDAEKGEMNIEKAKINLGRITCKINGKLKNLIEPDAKLHIEIKPFSTTNLKPYFPEVPSKIGLPSFVSDIDFKLASNFMKIRKMSYEAAFFSGALSGKVNWEPKFNYNFNLDLKANIPETNSSTIAKKFPAMPKNLKLPLMDIELRTLLKEDLVRIKHAKINTHKTALTSSLAVRFPKKGMDIKGNIQIKKGDIKEIAGIFPELKEYALSGSLKGHTKFSYKKRPIFSGLLSLNNFYGGKDLFRLNKVKGKLIFSEKKIDLKNLSGKLKDSNFRINLSAENYKRHPVIKYKGSLAQLKLPPLKPSAKTPVKKAGAKEKEKSIPIDISGSINIGKINHPNFVGREVSFKTNLKNIRPDMKEISGNTNFTMKDGEFSDLYQLATDYKIAKVVLAPLLLLQKSSKTLKLKGMPDFNNIEYSLIDGNYTFTKGLMKIEKSALNSNIADVKTTGKINLVNEKLDIRISAKLHKQSGISMSKTVDLIVKGTLTDPKVKPDIKSVLKQPAIKKALDKGVKKLFKNFLK